MKEEKAEKLQTKVLMKVTAEVCVDHAILNPLDLRKASLSQNITIKYLNTINIPTTCIDYTTSGAWDNSKETTFLWHKLKVK